MQERQFFIVRHAKSSWKDPSLTDKDRPLNKRGKHDAPKMAEHLRDQLNLQPDLIISSPANRALTTAKIFHKVLGPQNDIDIQMDLYHASTSDIDHVIHTCNDEFQKIMIFGHNPGFTYYVNRFTNDFLDNLPTCGVAQIRCTSTSWSEMNEENSRLMNLYFPKQLFY